MKSTAKSTKKPAATAINAITAQAAGAIVVTVQSTRKASASAKQLAPLVSAMRETGEDTTPALLSRLPRDTVAFQCFSSHAMSMASLFAWFSSNQARLTRTTRENKVLLDIAGAYCAAFDIEHDKGRDGPLKAYPFYKRFSNALQQWAARQGGFDKRASGAITDAVGAYLDKKEKENADALSDSIIAWVLKHETILKRILESA